MNFGQFLQAVLSHLVEDNGWDDPYAAISPAYDPDGKIVQSIYDAYKIGKPTDDWAKSVARSIDQTRFS